MSAEITYDVGVAILDIAAASLTCGTNTAPNVKIMTICEPPVDCEMLSVYTAVMRFRESEVPTLCSGINQVGYTVDLWRCICTNDDVIPTPAEQQAASLQLNIDGWLLWKGMAPQILGDSLAAALPAELGVCNNVAVGELICLNASGCYAGWRLQLGLDLDALGCEV